MNETPSPRFTAPAPPREGSPEDGILLVDKPSGPTSHDIVDAIRRKFGFKKVGHGGTLDPRATGLLVILLGRGTKLSERLMSSDKTYEGTLLLGTTTDSQDVDGEVLAQSPWEHVTREMLEAEMAKFRGDLYQTPPMVSAVKINGVPLYKHARKGKTVERKAKLIHVYEFRLIDFRPPNADFVMRCTKGTYVRTVCADIGEALGCGACLENLRRTVAGVFAIQQAVPLAEILKMDSAALLKKIIPLRRVA
jgi:tRNA pseudouridine55 synthase